MKQIKFSEEWDKLKPENRVVGRRFTTMRNYTEAKKEYYDRAKTYHTPFGATMNGKPYGIVNVVDTGIVHSRDLSINDIRADTYQDWTWYDFSRFLRKLYRTASLSLLVLTLEWTRIKESD